LLGAFLFTLVWLVTIEPCSTSDSIHSAIKLVFGRKSHKSSSLTELAKLSAWIEKTGKIFRSSKSDDDAADKDEDGDEDGDRDGDGSDDDGQQSTATATSADPFRLVLLGDSLVSESYKKLDLGGVIESLLDGAVADVSVINCGKSGSQIHTIKQRPLLNCTLPHTPDATILFFDSDVSAVDETELTADEVADVRAQYRADTSYVVQTLLDAGSQVLFFFYSSFGCDMPFLLSLSPHKHNTVHIRPPRSRCARPGCWARVPGCSGRCTRRGCTRSKRCWTSTRR